MKKLFVTTVLAVCFLSLPAFAQNHWITGQATDQTGAPIVGVTVTIKGSTTGTTTDPNGNYRIQGSAEDILLFQCLGYNAQEMKIGQKTSMDIELLESIEHLEDVVVTGYQTISKERATGSFDIVNKAQIEKPSSNIASRLIGTVAGLTSTQDAYGNPVFEIRGRSSLSSSATQPLLVVDGFAIEGGFESINPNDVESISILKDAAAASIWGAKSANGVIVITTKNARPEGGGTSVTVDYSGFLKVSPKLDLDYTLSQAPVNDVIDYEIKGFTSMDSSIWYHEESDYSGGMSRVYELLTQNRLGHLSEADMNAQIDQYRKYNNHDQIKKYLFQNPIVHQENVSVNIATERSSNTLSAMYQNSFSYTTDRYFSAFGNLSYTFDDRYTVSGSVRTDASNLITDDPKYRYAPFWSVGASWQIGKEKFMQDVAWVDALTLRATYGYNGNVDKSTTFKPLVNINTSPNVVTGEYTGSMSSYGNPTLRWERTGTWNIGVDFSLLRGKLFGKVDVYNKHSEDLIASVSLPSVQGTSTMKLNNGELLNKGIEMEVGSSLRISPNVSWTGTLTLSYNKNRIKSLAVEPSSAYTLAMSDGSSDGWMEGYDINTLWCYKYGGLQNVGSATSPVMKPTLVTKGGEYKTFDSWPAGDPLDHAYDMGTLVAPWNMAISTSFRVYDFDISLIITGKFGHKFKRESFNYPGISGRSIPNSKYSEVVNCDPNEIVPLPQTETETRYYFWNRFFPYMSYLVESASHMRLQEFNVTYNVPQKAVRKIGLRSLQVYAQCNNPFNVYFNKYNEDPEYPRGSIRLQASYTFGIKCKF